ncbi:temperature dependent protein affecting M2 dsRNA replication [Syncephalastrum racemosum]|uniref:Temperature dependent protein affecting M2 dsRNA replication n=1 Tax=Syncephalastrum racemosum TaxID=13706 RepID=A0A1X2HAR4_SYNRA|nr:temperature dependent protein affecting M2 dsRNA replication [Syncephalastrum racemosum]
MPLLHVYIHSLPYASDVNVAGGLIAKHYLEHMISGTASSQEALSKTESVFTSCGHVKADLERGFRFWQGLVLGIKAVKDSGDITEDTYNEFVEADQWLQKRNKL